MINFLPTLYEDEILYSVIARYQRMCGMVSKLALMKDLFGNKSISRSIFLPKNINAFVNNLPPMSKITTENIIMNHTMFPFYTAFFSEEKAKFVAKIMADDQDVAAENYIGIAGNRIKIGNYLRYCPVCYEEDLETFGESYWRRNHQIVGAFYCIKHSVLLNDSKVLCTGSQRNYTCADDTVCTSEVVPDAFSSKIKDLNLIYIKSAEYLLKGDYQRKELPFVINIYIDMLRERGFASKTGNLYLKEAQTEFLKYYPNQYLELMQSRVNPNKDKNWFRNFLWNDNANKSPIRHLLYLQFLGINLEDFFNINKVEGKTKGKTKGIYNYTPQFDIKERREKWLKIIEENKGANRGQLKKIGKGLHTWILRYDRDWYEKVTPRAQEIKPRDEYVNWEVRDKECLEVAKRAVESILRRPGKPVRITPSSITRTVGESVWFRRSNKLINTKTFMEDVKEDLNDFRIRKIKWAIEEMCKNEEYITPYKVQEYAGFGGNREVRGLIDKELEYLDVNRTQYKYEGEWYTRMIPSEKSKRKNAFDWNKRDKEYLVLAKKAYESILNEIGKPIRITPSSILQTIGVERWLFKPNMMKRTNQYLQEVKEDIDEFRIRKIKWAIEEMSENNIPVIPDKVRIYAGFRGGSKEIRKLILKVLKEW